jgi:hypothetical protein
MPKVGHLNKAVVQGTATTGGQTCTSFCRMFWRGTTIFVQNACLLWKEEQGSTVPAVGVVTNSLQDIEPPAVRYIYTLARVSWRLDSLVSRHRRVTQNSWDSEIVAGWCPWFFPFALEGFSTLNRVSPLWLISFYFVFHTSFITGDVLEFVSAPASAGGHGIDPSTRRCCGDTMWSCPREDDDEWPKKWRW